jgi:hypothetical protein
MVSHASLPGPSRLLTADAAAPPLPRSPDAEREAGSGHVRMVQLLIHAPTVGMESSFPPVVLPLLRAAPSAADALASPRRSLPPDSHAATWLQRQGSAMTA